MEIIKLNIIPNGITPICHASQFDIKRKIGIALFDNMDPYNLSGEETVSLSVRKPDKTIITKTLEIEAGNYLEFETTEQMCAIAGENKCEIKISYDDMTIGSLNFIMQVERDPLFKGIQSESEIENLQEQVNSAVAAAVSGQYDSENVIFDSEPTLNNGIPYTVTSDGIKRALNDKADLSALQAQNISYDNTQSGLTADDVQEAIDEVLGEIPEIPSTYAASDITYDNTSSGLSSNNAQDAIDELETEISNIPTSYDANEIGYDNTSSGLTATDAQGAIDEVLGSIPSSLAASAITYDNTNSGLTADDVQDAIDETVESVNEKASETAVAIAKGGNFIGVDYNVTPYNITTSSTLSSAVQLRYKYEGNLLTISGRIVLDISSRTGSNGGVTIALKSGKKIKNDLDNYVGVSTYKTEARNGEATILYASANSTSFRLSASESYANLQSGKTLVLYVSPLSIELADT